MATPFVKMHGCGNDFVIFDERAAPVGLTPRRAAAIANRRMGIGCDQLITLEPLPDGAGADVFMRIRNPDGSEVGACGNATRCDAQLLYAETARREQVIETVAGKLPAVMLDDGRIRVDMGRARLAWQEIPLNAPADTRHLDLAEGPVSDPAAASMGNPHATFFVDDLRTVPIREIGPKLENARIFPQRANIGFAQVISPERIRLRVWERGAGQTLACGSAACAAVVNAARRGLTGRLAIVEFARGEL
jgi:diaminopimelate epimerase